jgi:MFS family permease
MISWMLTRYQTERATSLGWFLGGTMVGPAFGPVLGGIIVTYSSWRTIFWVQTGLSGAAVLLTYFLLQETLHTIPARDLKGQGITYAIRRVCQWANPVTIFKLYACRNLLFVIFASSALVWNMYSLLTPVRYVLNPRLHLTTPLQSGLLYISPGAGYIIGVQIGGRWADYTVKQWIKKRGYRLPEDRLRSCLPFLGVLLPGSMLVYGWMIDKSIGGIPVSVICMFFQGVAQLAAFASLNAYILDVMQHRSGEASGMLFFFFFSFHQVTGTHLTFSLQPVTI